MEKHLDTWFAARLVANSNSARKFRMLNSCDNQLVPTRNSKKKRIPKKYQFFRSFPPCCGPESHVEVSQLVGPKLIQQVIFFMCMHEYPFAKQYAYNEYTYIYIDKYPCILYIIDSNTQDLTIQYMIWFFLIDLTRMKMSSLNEQLHPVSGMLKPLRLKKSKLYLTTLFPLLLADL